MGGYTRMRKGYNIDEWEKKKSGNRNKQKIHIYVQYNITALNASITYYG